MHAEAAATLVKDNRTASEVEMRGRRTTNNDQRKWRRRRRRCQ